MHKGFKRIAKLEHLLKGWQWSLCLLNAFICRASDCVTTCTDTEGKVVAIQKSSRLPCVFQANADGEAQPMPCSLCQTSFTGRSNCHVTYDVPAACRWELGTMCPMVFFFHESGGNSETWPLSVGGEIHSTNMHSTNRDFSFIGVYVQGTEQATGKAGWNTDSASIGDGPDDVGFVKGIIDMFRETFQWKGRLYAYGKSNGASMCQRLAVNGEMGFVGIASIAGVLLSMPSRSGPGPYNYNQPSLEACTVPVAYIGFRGASDYIIPYDGNTAPPGASKDQVLLMSVPDTNEEWAVLNGCYLPPKISEVVASGKEGKTSASLYTWPGCIASAPTEHYEISGVGNDITVNIDGKSIIHVAMNFFSEVEKVCDSNPRICPSIRADLPSSCSYWRDGGKVTPKVTSSVAARIRPALATLSLSMGLMCIIGVQSSMY